MKLIQKGSKGNDVKVWQQFLIDNGYLPQGEADGDFGKKTHNASEQFQSDNGLVVDGIVGKNTILKAVEFGFEKPKSFTREVNKIIIHVTASDNDATVEDIRQGHIRRGFSDIGYHLLIDRQGQILLGRDREKIGAHVEGHNVGSFAIACIARGSDKDSSAPFGTYLTEEQKTGLVTAVKQEMKNYGLTPDDVYGHNDFTNGKACPCFKVRTDKEFQKLIRS